MKMNKIQELSEQLANQIAAGEVVERPASVVKELVENALDAGSSQIDILLEEAGLRSIQVTDNGTGISEDEVTEAFKRHATSKIHTRDDLFRIRTLGFRGEALPSIASVAKVTLETAVAGEKQGTQLTLVGGKIEGKQAAPLRQGTKITVKDLFFNTPARLKYMKTLQTELANIGDVVNRLALAHPHVAFRLFHDGNQMLRTSGNGDLKQTIAGIYGVATAKKMREVSGKDLDFTLTGYLSLPEVTRANRNYITLLINGRYIKNFILNKAILAGYGSKLMVGRFPLAVICIEMDPLLVDVNVHPTKQEVRLSKEVELTHLITAAIQETLQEENLIPRAMEQLAEKKKEHEPKAEPLPLRLEPSEPTDLAFDAEKGEFYIQETPKSPFSQKMRIVDNYVDKNEENPGKKQPFKRDELESADKSMVGEDGPIALESVETVDNHLEKATNHFPMLEYFGQMHGTYLFAQSEAGLYIVDQHAAQERIKYEYYRQKIGEVGNDLQQLLVPIVLEYPHSDWLKINERREALEAVGVYLEAFGQNSFIIRAHPTWYPAGQEESLLRETVDQVLFTGKFDVHEFREATAIMMSCKRSIKANHHLDDRQARALLHDLAQCENPYNCPHGRPVLIHFTNKEMEKMFKRIQDPHMGKGVHE